MSIAIVGHGIVGQGMQRLFPRARIVDPPKGLADYDETRSVRLSIVAVPTPMAADGSCNITEVEKAVHAIRSPFILIKSTVPPGTTERLRHETGKRICFSPEYMGESTYWTPPWAPSPTDPLSHGFMIVGGESADCSEVADLFLPVLGPATRFRFMGSTEAELVKYAENGFFALKVTFANELRRICERLEINYHTVREGWLDDPRVGPMHTAAFRDAPGFGGKCLPKDISALAAMCRENGIPSPLLEAVIDLNGRQ